MGNGGIWEEVEGQSAFIDGNWRVYMYSSSSLIPRVLGDPASSWKSFVVQGRIKVGRKAIGRVQYILDWPHTSRSNNSDSHGEGVTLGQQHTNTGLFLVAVDKRGHLECVPRHSDTEHEPRGNSKTGIRIRISLGMTQIEKLFESQHLNLSHSPVFSWSCKFNLSTEI